MLAFHHILAIAVAATSLARAHTVITYPGWRGNNLHTNGTLPETNPDTIGVDFYEDGTTGFPYGMQWIYPCGGMPLTQNRTKWPVSGGAVSIQPGWFPGHSKALFYINIGIQEQGQSNPPNMSHPVVHPFQITGPNNSYYGGQFCLPQVGMPANLSLEVGQNITIQVIETAQHGAALYSCVDVTLVDDKDGDYEEVTPDNCYNSSDIGFNLLYTSQELTATGETNAAGALLPPAALMPPTATSPELPLALPTPTQQILTPTPNPPSRTHSPPAPTPPLSHKDPITTCLTLHNRPRSAHKLPPLQWSNALHHDAQKYAERLAGRGRMEHSTSLGEKGQGENLYASSNQKAGFKEAVGAWMGEERYYPKGARVGRGGGGGVGTWGHYCESL
ncbi:hypothetical protein D0860_00816 [Hortaea werneckii]|uniref:SCP domain-containing protein n=1 Tax=Hortaea werneckii TaxID=91943 RepID=A0A3M7HU53_HORWE|nr:hypothetical protein D0860_00816 [Hortaea werneckii]